MKLLKLIFAGLTFLISFSVYAEDGVSRSALTSAIEEKEPIDQIAELTNDKTKIFFFTEIKGMKDHIITHRWKYNGKVQADVKFDIGGDRWRVWSSKNLNESQLGEWTVSVLDVGGNVMAQQTFNYIEAVVEAEKIAEPPAESQTTEQ